jgi:hypothetical protein
MEGRTTTPPGRSRLSVVPTLASHVEAYERDIDRVLITEEEIQAAVRRLGEEVTRDYQGRSPLLIGVLKGGGQLRGGNQDLGRRSDPQGPRA